MEKEKEKIDVKAKGNFAGTSVKKNKTMNLNFVFSIEERANIIQAVMFVGQEISVFAKKEGEKPKFLGVYAFNSMKVDRDGETKITLNALTENAKMDEIFSISEDPENIFVRMVATIEMEG